MPSASEIDLWTHLFPALKSLKDEHFLAARSNVRFPVLEQGAVAYRQGAECPSYVMCLEGGTRTYKISASGRELLIYRVTPGSTCVFTTQCLFAGGTFPAESVAESRTRLAALPAATFHALMADSAEFRRLVLAIGQALLQIEARRFAATLFAGFAASIFHQNPPHRLRSNAEEMRAVAPRHLLINQLHIRFIHQRRSLQRMIVAFAAQIVMRQLVQFVIHQRHQFIARDLIAIAPGNQQLRDIGS